MTFKELKEKITVHSNKDFFIVEIKHSDKKTTTKKFYWNLENSEIYDRLFSVNAGQFQKVFGMTERQALIKLYLKSTFNQ